MIEMATQGFLHVKGMCCVCTMDNTKNDIKYIKIIFLKKLLTIHFTYSNITIVRGRQLRT